MFRKSHSFAIMARRAISKNVDTSKPPASAKAPAAGPSGINQNVPGLSSKCVKSASEPVGPGAAADATYKVPEYFCFNRFSFAEAELEMAKYRCPQPSAVKK